MLPEPYVEEFFKMLDLCRKDGLMLHFSERQETAMLSHSGIMIDFDRYQKAKDSQLTDRHFETLTNRIAKLLHEFIDFSHYGDKFTFHAFVIKKPSVVLQPLTVDPNGKRMGAVYKDGFHLLIPEIQITKGLKKHLINEMISRGLIKTVFKDIDHMEEPEKMLDKMSSSVPVYFLGGSKPEKIAYNLTHAYEVTIYLDDDEIDRRPVDVKLLLDSKSPDGKPINLTYELSLGFYQETFGGSPTWLKKRQLNYKLDLETKIQLIVEKTAGGILSDDEIGTNDRSVIEVVNGNPDAAYMQQLLAILDPSYATEYEKWFKVMCAIAHTKISYKDLAREFSMRRPDKMSEGEFERVWNEAVNGRNKPNPVTKRSLVHWAKISSPERFKELEKETYFKTLSKYTYDNEGRVEHTMVANVLHKMICDKFVVDVGYNDKSGRTGYCWYEFVEPAQSQKKGEVWKWRKEVEPDNVHIYIADQLFEVYQHQAQQLKDRKENADNEAWAKYYSNVEKTFRLYMSKLGNDGFQRGIISQAHYRFRKRGFYDELDSYEDVLGVGNGVLVIGAEPKLIKGFHEYKISKFTETDYYPFDPNNPYVVTLLNAFSDIFPEHDVREFMLFHASTGLDFRESACLLLLLVGGGQNGKSFFAKMIHNTLGHQYCAAGKSALLTAPIENGDKPNSAQMHMKDKRYFYFDEFNKCELLNTARVKSIVTPTWQSGRDLRDKQTNFKNTCNPIAFSNFDFIVDTTDHGTWRRIYYYRNKVKFCSNPAPGNKFEKPVNSKFIDVYANDPKYKEAMLSILVHYYSILCRDYGGDIKNVPCMTIKRETEAFRNRQDALNRFVTQMIVKSPGADPTGLPIIASRYSDWYNNNIKPTKQSIIDVQAQFENSRIASSLEHRASGIKFLLDHRMLDNAGEELRPGESYLTEDIKIPDEVPAPADAMVWERPNKEADDFVNALINNAPKHIQTRDNIADPISGMINSLLDGI